jgi:phosphomannomutase/phosphoglucomutase
MLKPTIFREYDIRGVADSELLSEDVAELGCGLGSFLRRKSGGRAINVGRDCRLSSTRLRDALIQGLRAAGCDVTDIGVVPTPVLYFSAQFLKANGAVMITGSHNPPEYNGFKSVCGPDTLHGESIQEVLRIIQRSDYERGDGKLQAADIVTPYVEEIASQFHFDRRVKVVVDAGNGTAGPAMHRILERLNLDATELFFDMDGRFPNHHPDPTVPANLSRLIEQVRETGADLGIAFDGDADRVGAVDEMGNVVYGDMLLLICAREILQRKPGATFIGEVKCSQLMYDEIGKLGGKAIMYKTGHSLIKAKMKEERAALAGEMSGHMFFADRYRGYDDGLYAACRLIEIVAKSGRPLSAQLAGLPKTVSTPEIRVDCADELKFDVVGRVAGHFKSKHKTVDIDGVRVIFPHGWGLLRASNTQPVLVMRFEATDERLLKEYRMEVEQALEDAKRTVKV